MVKPLSSSFKEEEVKGVKELKELRQQSIWIRRRTLVPYL
jgi:hypothetical protein